MASIWDYLFGGGKKKRAELLKALEPPTGAQRTIKKKKSWVYDPKTRQYGPSFTPAGVVKERFEVKKRGSGRRSFKKK